MKREFADKRPVLYAIQRNIQDKRTSLLVEDSVVETGHVSTSYTEIILYLWESVHITWPPNKQRS